VVIRCCSIGRANAAVLPVPRLGDSEQIPAREQMRDGACLYGGWFSEALFRERAQQRLDQTEVGEAVQWHEVDAPAPANA
jgi:hypothetical protein